MHFVHNICFPLSPKRSETETDKSFSVHESPSIPRCLKQTSISTDVKACRASCDSPAGFALAAGSGQTKDHCSCRTLCGRFLARLVLPHPWDGKEGRHEPTVLRNGTLKNASLSGILRPATSANSLWRYLSVEPMCAIVLFPILRTKISFSV
jgi:hypothetical protein